MLFKQINLSRIKSGKITLAFRKWQKAPVKSGSLLHTAIGLIKIHKIEIVNENDITDKISVSYHSADPRIKLRAQRELSEQLFTDLKSKLKRLDNHGKQGHWTRKILLTIKDNPNLHAIGVAKLTGFEKGWLKLNIRKLKNLGLTISHKVGYELSPLGKRFTEKLLSEK